MKVNQQGLQSSYTRAFNAIVRANLSKYGSPDYQAYPGHWGYAPAYVTASIQEAQNAVLSLSYLRLEQQITTTSNIISFPILVNATTQNQPVRPTERRLAQQDSFFCSSIQIFIAIAASATDSAFRLETYPNVNIFPTGAAGNETVAPLNVLYNGWLSININKNVIVPQYPLSDFMQVPQTQRLTTTAANQSNQFDPTEVALWEPNINFVGTKDSRIQIELPQQISAVDAFTYVVIKLNGTLAQNVTIMT